MKRYLTTGKRAKTTKLDFRCPILSLCHWSSQLLDLRAPSSTDAPVRLLNQPINLVVKTELVNRGGPNNFLPIKRGGGIIREGG